MGIPKFFRTMSERYPLISQLVEENKIPEFDNLYLDMNGIIHNCSHPNDGDAHFRLSEADMFLAIFSYIEHIFAKIKPQKFFFLAIDGVAPRAKMNQQRSRRFRTAQEAKELKEKAERRGEELPEEEAFDSNCITPGTPFMARLQAQLEYFLAKKQTEDSLWRNVEVVLSGHDVPGEGEHKIMEYIRLAKAQPEYNSNVRHCLYGLDADLIMLGLLSHDPHFALLREEVNFGPSRHKKKGGLESQNFYLLHLSLFREYLDVEFQELKTTLPFEFSLERVIDDFVLLNIFVGNDFLPHLPGLHINEGALGLLFRIYTKILPQAGGYINEDGRLRTDRLGLVLSELTNFEREQLEDELADASWQHSKQSKSNKAKAKAKSSLVLTAHQRVLFEQIKRFIYAMRGNAAAEREMFLPGSANSADRKFLGRLITDLGLEVSFDEYDPEADAPAIAVSRRAPLDGDDEDDENDEESRQAIDRVIAKYESAKTEDASDEQVDEEEEYSRLLKEKHDQIKREYYKQKLNINYDDKEQMRQLAYRYVEGLQWVLHYYYDGVASWGWFYDYHYAPMISDLTDVADMTFSFDLGKPFRPFDQLMGVLPSLSAQHIPEAFRDLMTDPASPIIDFYPSRFEADFNGKKQSWEAVVKIPFIDENRLLAALNKREGLLTSEERKRNSFGHSVRITYEESRDDFYASPLPGVFPDILHCKASISAFHLPTLDGTHLVKGLCDGVGLGVEALAGFPSIKTLPHYGRLARHGVSVFQSESRNDSIVISIENTFEEAKCEEVAADYIGKRTFVNWPFLTEGIVTAVSDESARYQAKLLKNGSSTIVKTPLESFEVGEWKRKAANIERHYSKRYGVLIGSVDIVLHVRPLKGLARMQDGSFLKDYEGDSKNEIDQAIQVSVATVTNEDARYLERPPLPLPLEFPERARVFYLGAHAYGSPASVLAVSRKEIAIELISLGNQSKELALLSQLVHSRQPEKYYSAYELCKQLRISGLALSKITSSMLLDHDSSRTNVGLNLKFEAKGQKVLGYSRRSAAGWEYSEKTLGLLRDYNTRFPEVAKTIMDNAGRDIRNARDIFGDNSGTKMTEVKAWLKATGVRDLEAVPLFAEQLETTSVQAIERFTAQLAAFNADKIRRVVLRGIPRAALLKPAHAPYRLTSQKFALGDRVVCVSDSGIVPISSRGVVVGINPSSLDVVFDAPFLAGSTLDDRCGAYKGATVPFTALLNLSNQQHICTDTSAQPEAAAAISPSTNASENNGVMPHKKSALERTLALEPIASNGHGKPNGKNASEGGNAYRPPSHFKPARNPQAPAVGTRGGGMQALGTRAADTAPRVDQGTKFSHVTSGQARPRPPARNGGAASAAGRGVDSLNPHLAALNFGTRGGAPPTGPRGRGRGRGG